MSFAHWVAESSVTGHSPRLDRFTVEILAAEKICRAASRKCYATQNVGNEWPIPVFRTAVACALRSTPGGAGDRGLRLHDCGQWALAARPARREVAD